MGYSESVSSRTPVAVLRPPTERKAGVFFKRFCAEQSVFGDRRNMSAMEEYRRLFEKRIDNGVALDEACLHRSLRRFEILVVSRTGCDFAFRCRIVSRIGDTDGVVPQPVRRFMR